MADEILQPRPAVIAFGTKSDTTELYPATVIKKPFADEFFKPEIKNAYSNQAGDIIFYTNKFDWFVMPQGGKEAYKIKERGYGGSSDGFKAQFATDFKGENEIVLEVNEKAGKALFGNEKLNILSKKEKDALLQSGLSGKISFIEMPDIRQIKEAFQIPDGDYIVISSSKTVTKAYDHVFKGKDLHNLREIPVIGEVYSMNGEMTFYKTTEGTIYRQKEPKKDASWAPIDSKQEIKLNQLDEKEILKQIGTDTRIDGIETWKQHLESASKKSKGANNSDRSSPEKFQASASPEMQKALEQFANEIKSAISSATILPQPQRDLSNSRLA